ncbi:endolytic peptidoglycan transglycosylase RlpA [Salmonella enterica subsp. enterica serovar Java]|uniref:Endolytic peptidoglycan transglycosylase RlpA n=10 Tax=Salmonella enterica TaxID=28901 RepID=A0A747EVG7_SALER|nr:endolytic peptidoglycan transglycosylase RlpA [Salmonella enterica]EAA4373352.1 endolytic peptidoglycan transglycosylase RlpA [Salmonella enterica subsp. enterica serovar Abony]EDS9040936.1 endolytic peptidoglycan transglycosylase RlpA [Salmonella enterica subsp. enterica serovar Reading]EDW4641198.1 endolytic peptidoglycan transglycosylase RlpA [Salmonella enterica subsp. enterica serovar Java]EED3596021.1 endolytic peptidoglycan transglycosylase RlpA [Salmonella enterica subsp. salamae]EA
MRKQLPVICVAAGIVLLAACTNDGGQQQTTVAPQPAVCNGPTVEISGAEPRYEPLNPTANQDYQRDGKSYKIVQDPSRFSQAGLAAIYDAEPGSNLTASGEMFDPMQLTAAHPTLPIPSYARITNLANGRMIVVRINDRGPYGTDRVISLSRAAADRLNTSNNTKVRIDPIIVAPDGSLSGPGMACTTVAKQTYALPPRPDLSGGMGSASSAPAQPQGDVLPVSNSTLKSDDTTGAPVSSSGFLGAPTTLAPGVLEGNEPTPAPQPAPVSAPVAAPATATPVSAPAAAAPVSAPVSAPATAAPVSAPVSAPATAASGRFVVQVGAVSDQTRAQQYQQRLSQQFSVPGRVIQNGAVWRIQLGPFASKAEASALQQRLQTEAQLQSFIASAQ